MENFEIVVKVCSMLLSLIAGLGGLIPVVNWLKTKLGVSGLGAQLLAAAAATIFATITGVASGAITPELATVDHIVDLFLMVLTAAWAQYERLKRQGLA